MNAIQKNMALSLISVIGKNNIVKMINSLISLVLSEKDKIPLQENEKEICGLFFENDNEVYYSTIAVSKPDENSPIQITRFVSTYKLAEFVDKGLTALKELE
jgi:hypothetical protein